MVQVDRAGPADDDHLDLAGFWGAPHPEVPEVPLAAVNRENRVPRFHLLMYLPSITRICMNRQYCERFSSSLKTTTGNRNWKTSVGPMSRFPLR